MKPGLLLRLTDRIAALWDPGRPLARALHQELAGLLPKAEAAAAEIHELHARHGPSLRDLLPIVEEMGPGPRPRLLGQEIRALLGLCEQGGQRLTDARRLLEELSRLRGEALEARAARIRQELTALGRLPREVRRWFLEIVNNVSELRRDRRVGAVCAEPRSEAEP